MRAHAENMIVPNGERGRRLNRARYTSHTRIRIFLRGKWRRRCVYVCRDGQDQATGCFCCYYYLLVQLLLLLLLLLLFKCNACKMMLCSVYSVNAASAHKSGAFHIHNDAWQRWWQLMVATTTTTEPTWMLCVCGLFPRSTFCS